MASFVLGRLFTTCATFISPPMMLFLTILLAAAAGASTLNPPVLPLIVRNPYLSTWLANARDPPWEHWPMFWTGQELGLSVMASIPQTKIIYPLLGRPHDSLPTTASFTVSLPTYHGASFDASTTNLTYTLDASDSSNDPVRVTLSFLSPITPTSTLRQSIPAAYMAIFVEGSVDVNVYTDVNGEWVSGNGDSMIGWKLQDPSSELGNRELPIKSWSVSRRTELCFTESSDRAEWGAFQFTAPSSAQHQSGTSAAVRLQFAQQGRLTGEVDNRFRPIKDSEPVFAFSTSFGFSKGVGNETEQGSKKGSIVFTLALVQDPVVQFAAARGLTYMRPLWASYFPQPADMLAYHYADFEGASRLANDYSRQLAADATASDSPSYRDIVSLSARQVLGATQFAGTPDNPIVFLKEISSNGNFQTVDVIFPAFPFFLYTNPRWLAYVLEPLLEHQLSGQYPNDYSMHDIGTHFPNATGHADGNDEYMPVEECGNMLIMGLALVNSIRHAPQHPVWAHSQRHGRFVPWMPGSREGPAPAPGTRGSGTLPLEVDEFGQDRPFPVDGATGEESARAWASRSYKLWKQWTGYLVRESLIPRNQLSTDDFAGWLANQTNLALKGIIGIRAMAEISELVGERRDAQQYSDISRSYIDKWLGYGISRDGTHAKLAYTWYGSWTTLYNLFADSLLCFHAPKGSTSRPGGRQKPLGLSENDLFIPRRVYSMQSNWYRAVLQRYGLPLDSRHLYTKSDWEFFAAAVASGKTRATIVESVALWVNETVSDRPLTDLYDTEGEGDFSPTRFMARPVVGGHFARLALERACEGRAREGLEFLDKEASVDVDAAGALAAEASAGDEVVEGSLEL
ncbi:Uncharacterized protein TCAP_00350 [Tolypocladium capitatum]|uniref:Glutaminase A n=1 Tax=Tolypocladium capitatum TaxID=45235 RepID=A0A2K3QQD3_9HYPO|nr:Uncharacterized protein TCAP_00350 [Tolypocladium capitatum]